MCKVLEIELWSPQSYKDATPEELAEITNGAGPQLGNSDLGGKLVPDRLIGLSITASANIHDWMYHESESEMDRLQADLTFLRNMVVEIMKADLNPDATFWGRRKTLPRIIIAAHYFIAVWRLGGSFHG
jgi:hypothetical protein